jgi:hypothetical protein
MSAALKAFQSLCHEYYTCYVFASAGMEKHVDGLPFDPAKYPNQQIYIGHTDPEKGKPQSVMSAAKAAANAKRDGEFQDILGKALMIRIYHEWDERFRHEMAKEFSVEANKVTCDLMGDLRRVRHWIVHNKSIIGPNVIKMRILPWKLKEGGLLHVTSAMFREFADCINNMQVRVNI